ncbi:MAG: hypothetical protein WCR30_00565 [Clostridia bacterium]
MDNVINKNEKSCVKKKTSHSKLLEKKLLKQKFADENKLEYTDNEEAIVECNIGSLTNIYSRYDMQKSKTLEPLLFEYMMEETDIVPLNNNLQLNMCVYNNTTDEEEVQARKALKTHFSFNIARDNFILRRKIKKGIIYFLCGILTLFLSSFVVTLNTKVPLYELMLIFTWFFSWEASDIILIECNKIKKHRLNMLRLYNAKVIFVRSIVPPRSLIMVKRNSKKTKTKMVVMDNH